MKYLLSLFTVLIVGYLGAPAQYTLGISYGHTVGGTGHPSCYNMVMPELGYAINLDKGFILTPEVGIYAQWGQRKRDYGIVYKDATTAVGLNLGVHLSKEIYKGFGILTGPDLRCNVYQHESHTNNHNNSSSSGSYPGHRAALLWKVGAMYHYQKWSFTAFYDIAVTKQFNIESYPATHTPTFGVLGLTVAHSL